MMYVLLVENKLSALPNRILSSTQELSFVSILWGKILCKTRRKLPKLCAKGEKKLLPNTVKILPIYAPQLLT